MRWRPRPSASPRSGGSPCRRRRMRRASAALGRRGRGGDPPARRGAARLDLGGRPGAPPHAVEPHRRVRRDGASGPARPPAASSSTGRTRPASSPSSSGRTSAARWRAARTGASTNRRCSGTVTSSSRCWNGSAPRDRSAPATSRAPATAPRCGTGSRRRRCSRRCGTAECSPSRAGSRSSAATTSPSA